MPDKDAPNVDSGNTVAEGRTRGLRPWKAGESPNPSGRPKDAHLKRLCRANAETLAPYLLEKAIHPDTPLKEATEAFRALCEYGGYLTEEQRVKAVVAGLGLTHLTNEQRNKLIDQIKPADVEEAPAIEEKK